MGWYDKDVWDSKLWRIKSSKTRPKKKKEKKKAEVKQNTVPANNEKEFSNKEWKDMGKASSFDFKSKKVEDAKFAQKFKEMIDDVEDEDDYDDDEVAEHRNVTDLTVTWFLLVGDAITHYKTETQDYYVWDMGKMNQIDKLMENVSVSDESDWLNITDKWKTSEAYQAYRRLHPESEQYERPESEFVMIGRNESEDNAYAEQYLADMMEKVDAYNKKKKAEALNQTKIEKERQVNRSKTELMPLTKDATEKPKGFGGIGVVFELRQTILRQKSITKTREKSGEIYEDSKEYLPVVDQILPDSPARKIGKIKPGDILLSVGDKSTKGMEVHQLAPYILGPVGSSVSLKFRRGMDVFVVSLRRQAVGGNVLKQLPSVVEHDLAAKEGSAAQQASRTLNTSSWNVLIKKPKRKKTKAAAITRGKPSTPQELQRAAVVCRACDGFTTAHPTVDHALGRCEGVDDFITVIRNISTLNGPQTPFSLLRLHNDPDTVGPAEPQGSVWLESTHKSAILSCKDEESDISLVGLSFRHSFIGPEYVRDSLPFVWTSCLKAEQGKLTISRCTVLCEGGVGLFVDFRSDVECFSSSFSHNGGDGVVCVNGGQVKLEDCDLGFNGKSGLYCTDPVSLIRATSCRIRGNEFQGACVTRGGYLHLINCWLEENKESAVSSFNSGSSFDLINSDLVGNAHGVHVEDGGCGICVRCRVVGNKEFGAIAVGDGTGLVLRFCQVGLLLPCWELSTEDAPPAHQVEGNYIGVATEEKATIALMETRVDKNTLTEASNLKNEGVISGLQDLNLRSKREEELFELEPEIDQY
ncbi:hypothetical protein GUITHDRAFT_142468 [Guillardia theta CCMP2712]|uniref:PDZ domain-containing protein n=1 Tax=Guillardia theta (strain CCMP2712) TaxID=905079 RepID=L1IYF3_GUITC|nr:hypothetical protein GUITHDRAFT_142468 [Guillardia theta CCMP2712]EKX40850.1 hypothetical protein GUITHDRAFT_142468 [Guillardia theta CCMP2712]|eukprot:XP_005827830.1 hypothetical protein GUITHDRAFT_142468 [Guillardia theta CCMP2712]